MNRTDQPVKCYLMAYNLIIQMVLHYKVLQEVVLCINE